MLDFSFGELAVVAFVAFFIVGPKEFPVIMRQLGRWFGHFKSLSDEFKAGVRSAMHQHGVDVETDLATIREEVNFIRDQHGQLQRVYDISDFMEENKRPQMKPLPASAPSPSAANEEPASHAGG